MLRARRTIQSALLGLCVTGCLNDWAHKAVSDGGARQDASDLEDAAVTPASPAYGDDGGAVVRPDAGGDPCLGQCAGGRCEQLGNSFACTCNAGFELSEDRQSCLDIDECKTADCAAAYPCMQTEPPGYVCLGERADWPLAPDGDRTGEVPLDARSTPGVVKDPVTGLWWQAEHRNDLTWDEARETCASLRLGDADDWRLPGIIELVSITDYARFQPALDSNAFPDTPGDGFWSSSPSFAATDDTARHWTILMHDGDTVRSDDLYLNAARCVRTARPPASGTPDRRYRVNPSSSSLTDRRTGLEWQSQIDAYVASYADASTYCKSYGMRLPTVKELLSVVDFARAEPAIDPIPFTQWTSTFFWTSTPNNNPICRPGECGWDVDFKTGEAHSGTLYVDTATGEAASESVRCVRAPR